MSTVCVIVGNRSTMYDLVELLNMPLDTFNGKIQGIMIDPDASEEDKMKLKGFIESLKKLEQSLEPTLCTGLIQRIDNEIDDRVPFLPYVASKHRVCDKFMHPSKERLEHSSRKRNKYVKR